MSENGDERGRQHQQGRRPRGASSDEKELASQQIQIQSKRFYIDVKENQRGRFVKLAEVGVGGRKSRIIMALSAASEFKAFLVQFSQLHAQMGPAPAQVAAADQEGSKTSSSTKDSDQLIKSETIVKDRKRYYLDLKENQRGRFLKVSMILNRGGNRAQIAIPAQGLAEFGDHLSDLLDRFAVEEEGLNTAGGSGASQAELPESKSFRADNKTFYFDCGANARGVYVKISEVRLNRYRTSITIPDKFLQQFQESLSEFADKTKALALTEHEEHEQEEEEDSPGSKPAGAGTDAAASKTATAIANGAKD